MPAFVFVYMYIYVRMYVHSCWLSEYEWVYLTHAFMTSTLSSSYFRVLRQNLHSFIFTAFTRAKIFHIFCNPIILEFEIFFYFETKQICLRSFYVSLSMYFKYRNHWENIYIYLRPWFTFRFNLMTPNGLYISRKQIWENSLDLIT